MSRSTTLYNAMASFDKFPLTVNRIEADWEPQRETVQAAQRFVFARVNRDDGLLRNYELTLRILETGVDVNEETALNHSMAISEQFLSCDASLDQSSLISPIVLGCPFSAYSELTSRVFTLFHMLQISATSSSKELCSEPVQSFFRTNGNNYVVAQRLLQLCQQRAWSSILVVYQNDAWGQDYWTSIQEQAEEYGISAKSKKVTRGNQEDIEAAADLLHEEDALSVSILAMFGDDVARFLKYGDFGDGYSFIGTDGWFAEGVIAQYNMTNATKGRSFGALPFDAGLLTLDEYRTYNISGANETIYNESRSIYDSVTAHLLNENSFPIMRSVMCNAYDAAYALALALDAYEHKYYPRTLREALADCNGRRHVAAALRAILVEMPPFIGCSGLVQFDENGDRVDSSLLYGYVTENGSIRILANTSDICGYCAPSADSKASDHEGERTMTVTPMMAALITVSMAAFALCTCICIVAGLACYIYPRRASGQKALSDDAATRGQEDSEVAPFQVQQEDEVQSTLHETESDNECICEETKERESTTDIVSYPYSPVASEQHDKTLALIYGDCTETSQDAARWRRQREGVPLRTETTTMTEQ